MPAGRRRSPPGKHVSNNINIVWTPERIMAHHMNKTKETSSRPICEPLGIPWRNATPSTFHDIGVRMRTESCDQNCEQFAPQRLR